MIHYDLTTNKSGLFQSNRNYIQFTQYTNVKIEQKQIHDWHIITLYSIALLSSITQHKAQDLRGKPHENITFRNQNQSAKSIDKNIIISEFLIPTLITDQGPQSQTYTTNPHIPELYSI